MLRLLTLHAAHPEPDEHAPPVSPAVGRFDARFSPRTWRPQFPCSAFDRMTPADGRWIAAQIQRVGRPQLEAIVAAAHYSDPRDAAYIVDTLLQRRELILRQYGPVRQDSALR